MIKKVLKILGGITLTLVAFILIYSLSAYLLSRISLEAETTTQNDVVIYIKTNGVHTDIVVPVRTQQINWIDKIPFTNIQAKDTNFLYLGMGWGDKGFYLETPTWADLKASVALKAAIGLSTAAIHATYFKNITEDHSCKKIIVSHDQYERLIKYMMNSFQIDNNGRVIHIKTTANYGTTDAFYEAKGSYSLFHTCNTWANNALKACGQKCCLWTPFDTGIFLNYQ